MAKKRHRSTYTSKGQRVNSVSLGDLRTECDKVLSKVAAWKQGKNPWVTVVNRGVRNMPFIKVRANDLWGNYKTARANIFNNKSEV